MSLRARRAAPRARGPRAGPPVCLDACLDVDPPLILFCLFLFCVLQSDPRSTPTSKSGGGSGAPSGPPGSSGVKPPGAPPGGAGPSPHYPPSPYLPPGAAGPRPDLPPGPPRPDLPPSAAYPPGHPNNYLRPPVSLRPHPRPHLVLPFLLFVCLFFPSCHPRRSWRSAGRPRAAHSPARRRRRPALLYILSIAAPLLPHPRLCVLAPASLPNTGPVSYISRVYLLPPPSGRP